MIEEFNTCCDEYIDKSAPWKLAKQPDTQPQLHTRAEYDPREAFALLAILLYPFMPTAATADDPANSACRWISPSRFRLMPLFGTRRSPAARIQKRHVPLPPHRIQTTRSQTRERDTCFSATDRRHPDHCRSRARLLRQPPRLLRSPRRSPSTNS